MQHPKIIECRHFIFNTEQSDVVHARRVTDYELDLDIAGGRILKYPDKPSYVTRPGTVIFRRPGTIGRTTRGNYDIYTLTLTFDPSIPPNERIRNESETRQTQPPVDYLGWHVLPEAFEPPCFAAVAEIYKKLLYLHTQPSREALCQDLVARAVHLLCADALAIRTQSHLAPSAVDPAIAYVNDNFARRITLDELAEHVHLNKSYLVRLFRQKLGQTPIEYLNSIRLAESRFLLPGSTCRIEEIAWQCGFESASYFIMRFRRRYGITPE